MKIITVAALFVLSFQPVLVGANPASTFVDENGVMRWTATHEEIAAFGVNYTAPFAHAFRAHQRLGIPIERAIDADVYHFSRLGLNAYRIHVWDREISDPDGNLVVNEHVKALDYLLAKLKERGIKIILTPLQFGNAAYPEGGLPLNGFSSKYGKQGCLEDRTSWPLQERYLAQFMQHVNPHTGVAYKDEPDLIAIEICNEPGHFDYAPTLEYINRMTQAIRDTGCQKPVLYNMSHGLPIFQAYLDANVQGGTFQWYPSNLVANHEQWGNFLPYVDDYPIPFAANEKFKSKAKIVYEYDSADIGRSYIYPAIARTFRKTGVQFATQFAYDPLYIAPVNTEYQTHFLNLAYAPQKALSLKVAGEAFRRIPLYKDFGSYPNNTSFAGVRVSYTEDLSELVTEEKFFYSNRTTSKPPAPDRLQHIAGYGDSPVINYPGQGAYFLDRLESGVWRLEVMPDAIWVRDPFEKPNPTKQVSRIAWNPWPMRIELPDLGIAFSATGLNDGNQFKGQADGQTLTVRPGTYLLTRQSVTTKLRGEDKWENITLKEFVAPPASLDKIYVLHQPVVEASAGENLRVTATIASPEAIDKVELVAFLPGSSVVADDSDEPGKRTQPGKGNTPGTGPQASDGSTTFAMTRISGFRYVVEIPGAQLRSGTLRYHIVVSGPAGTMTFPSMIPTRPTNWDFYGEAWTARIVPTGAPILLFDAAADTAKITADHRDVHYDLVPSDRPGTSAMAVVARDLSRGEHDHSFRFYFKEKINGRTGNLSRLSYPTDGNSLVEGPSPDGPRPTGRRALQKTGDSDDLSQRSSSGAAGKIVLYGRSATDQPCPLQLALVTADGVAYGGLVTVQPINGTYTIPLSSLHQVRSPNIPHGYPVFINFWSSISTAIPLDLNRVEAVLVSIGPGISANDYSAPHGVNIERIWLE